VLGISTRKVDDLMAALGGCSMNSTVRDENAKPPKLCPLTWCTTPRLTPARPHPGTWISKRETRLELATSTLEGSRSTN
jgi:hypothetical protein